MNTYQLVDHLRAIEIPLDQIYLDPNNPRFAASDSTFISDEEIALPAIQEETRVRLVREFGVGKLRLNMEVNGFLPIDRVVVREFANQKYVVLEGNRRICAAKLVSSMTHEGEEVSKSVIQSLKEIPCLQYTGSDRQAAWIIQGLRHITGLLDWSSFNKAKLLVEQKEEEELSLTEVGKRFGLTSHGAGQWVRGYYAFRQAKEKSDFIEEVDERLYPYLQELFSRSSIRVREWMEWNDQEFEFQNSLHFNEFIGWFYPKPEVDDGAAPESLGDWNNRAISRQDDIRQIAYLISEAPSSFDEFRNDWRASIPWKKFSNLYRPPRKLWRTFPSSS